MELSHKKQVALHDFAMTACFNDNSYTSQIHDSNGSESLAPNAYLDSSVHNVLGMSPVIRCCCRATGATALVKLAAPQPDELGFAKSLALEEIGGTNVVVLQQDASQGQVLLLQQ